MARQETIHEPQLTFPTSGILRSVEKRVQKFQDGETSHFQILA